MDGLAKIEHAMCRVKSVRLLILVGLVLLAGCSQWQIGAKDYGCPGMPEGARCMSSRDVYLATDNGPLNAQPDDVATELESGAQTGSNVNTGDQNSVVQRYVAPALPDKPVPIRTPAEVMRIWIAPWEDDNGDLNVTGYLYTEIEPRRWVIADKAEKTAPSLTPLVVKQNDQSRTKLNSNTEEGK